jgi:hypothetical protein
MKRHQCIFMGPLFMEPTLFLLHSLREVVCADKQKFISLYILRLRSLDSFHFLFDSSVSLSARHVLLAVWFFHLFWILDLWQGCLYRLICRIKMVESVAFDVSYAVLVSASLSSSGTIVCSLFDLLCRRSSNRQSVATTRSTGTNLRAQLKPIKALLSRRYVSQLRTLRQPLILDASSYLYAFI